MKTSKALIWLSSLVAVLALISSGTGLFWHNGGSRFPFTTLHGHTTEMYGRGLYRYDTLFTGAAFRGTDAVTLFVGIPLLVFALMRYRRGSLRGGFLLTGVLAYFLYNSSSMAFGAAYNALFLVYVGLFSASLFAFVLSIISIDLHTLPAHMSSRLPRRGIAGFMFVAGTGTLFVWLSHILGDLIQGRAPEEIGSYTTLITHAIDLGVIVPAAFLAGVLLLRRAPLGYLLATPLLVLCSLIGLVVVAQTTMQIREGITFDPGVFVGMIGSWVALSAFALWFTAALLRNIVDRSPVRPMQPVSSGKSVARSV